MNTEKIELLEKTVAANPKDHKSWYELGLEFFETDFQKARECFSMAIAQEPFNAEYVFRRGWKCLSADCYEEAMADFALAIRLAPIDGFKWHYLANSYYFLGQYEQAAEYYRMAITMYQKTGVNLIPPAVDWIWMCNMRLGRKDAAKAIVDEFITPDIPVDDSAAVEASHRVAEGSPQLPDLGGVPLDRFQPVGQQRPFDILFQNQERPVPFRRFIHLREVFLPHPQQPPVDLPFPLAAAEDNPAAEGPVLPEAHLPRLLLGEELQEVVFPHQAVLNPGGRAYIHPRAHRCIPGSCCWRSISSSSMTVLCRLAANRMTLSRRLRG